MQATFEYHRLLRKILYKGTLKENRTGINTISIFDYKLELDMNQGFPLITTKKMYTKGIIGELLWFLTGSTDIRDLWKRDIKVWDGNWYDYYLKAAKKAGIEDPYTIEELKERQDDPVLQQGIFEMGPIYGKQWVNWELPNYSFEHVEYGEPNTHHINQIQQVMDKLINRPDDRRMMVSAWNIADIPKMCLPPCHWAFELYTEELSTSERYDLWFANNYETGMERHFDPDNLPNFDDEYYTPTPTRRLSLKWHQRSVDTFLGLPFNIASYAFLLHMFADQANMVPGKLIGDLTNVHIYENHIDLVKEQLERDHFKYCAPKLTLEKAEDIFSYEINNFKIEGYNSYPNWKNVHMAV